MHIHHVQFDPQALGRRDHRHVATSSRSAPTRSEDPTLTAAAAAGDTTLCALERGQVHPFLCGRGSCDHVWIGIGLGTEQIEVRQIASVDAAHDTVTLTQPLANAHSAG